MRIRTLLRACLAVFMLMVLVLAGVTVAVSARVAAISAQQERAGDLSGETATLLALVQEYALHGEERVVREFRARGAAFASTLQSAAAAPVPLPQQALQEAAQLRELFERLVDTEAADAGLHARQESLVLGLAQANTQMLAASIHRWSGDVGAQRTSINAAFRWLALGVPVLMLLTLVLLAMLLDRRVLRPLATLQAAVQAVARGDLSVRSALNTRDEFGELSRAFDRMAVELVGELRREIAQREESAHELAASEHRLRQFSEAASEGLMFHEQGIIVDANEAFARLYGIEAPAQLIGRHCLDVLPLTPDTRKRVAQRMQARQADVGEIDCVWPDGTRRVLESAGRNVVFRGREARLVTVHDVTERKRAETLLQVRLQIAESSRTGGVNAVLQTALDAAEAVTDSRIGFFHFVETDEETLSLQAWSSNTLLHMCKAEGKGKHYPVSEAGVWVDCVRRREPVIHNDYASLPHKKGMPAGHASVVRELVVPVIREGRVTAILGVGNKAAPYLQADVDAVQLIATAVQDIVERHRAEEALRGEQGLLAQVAASSPVGVVVVNRDGRIRFANRVAETILGLKKGEITQRSYDAPEWKHTDLAGRPLAPERLPVARVFAGGGPVSDVEHGIEWPDGRRVLLSVNAAPLFDAAGAVGGVVAAVTDITARKRGEQLTALGSAIAHGLAFNDGSESGLKAVMRAVCESMNWLRSTYWRADEAAGVMRFEEVWNAPDLDTEGFIDRARAMEFAPGVGLVGQVWQSGEPLWIADVERDPPWWRAPLVSSFGMRSMLGFAVTADGRTIGVLTFASREVREPDAHLIASMRVIGSQLGQFLQRRRAEEQLHKLNAELELRVAERTRNLEAANGELETFSYAVSHDLRAPLRAIEGFSSLLEGDCGAALDERGRDYLRRVRAATSRMGSLIDDLLALSRISRQELRRGPVDLSALAREVVEELKAAEPQRRVECAISSDIKVDGDPGLLRIALQNLLGNAWKYSSRCEHPRIRFGAEQKDGRVTYFVRDNGAGFDMAQSGSLFKPFKRLHTTQEFPGTGVGLATVARIVDRHGGKIWADGRPGEGASFYFSLG